MFETQKEAIFEQPEQRKLAEDDNYIAVYFNQTVEYNDSIKFVHQKRNNVSKIVVDETELNPDSNFTVPLGKALKIYFTEIVSSLEQFFSGNNDKNSKFITSIDLSNCDLSKVTTMSNTFYSCSSLESVIFPENMQNVRVMEQAFTRCSSLKSIDFSKCNLTNVLNMNNMFQYCVSLESIALPDSLTNIQNMNYMFHNCSSLQSVDFSNIGLTKIITIYSMFEICPKLESVIFPKSSPERLTSITRLLLNCSSLTSIDLSMFTILQTTSINSFIDGCTSLVSIDFPNFNFTTYDFLNYYNSNQEVFHFKYLNLIGSSGESINFSNFFTDLCDDFGMTSLSVCVSDKEIIQTSRNILYKKGLEIDLDFCCNYTECRFINPPNYIIVNFNKECTYANGFENDYRPNIYSIILDGVEKEKNEQLDVKRGSKMIIHFTAPLTDFSNFFSSKYDENVKNIISIDFSNFNSSLIDKLFSSFKGCTSLQSLDLSNFIVSSETVISNMIEDCSSLVSIDISNFDLTNNEILKIFKNVGKLLYVNLINCLGETNDIYTFLETLKGVNNNKKFICINSNIFNEVSSQYKESNNGDSIENVFEKCCIFDFETFECRYLLVSFSNESTYESGFENDYRANIHTIILDDEEKSKNDALTIQAGSKMKIYFTRVTSNFSNFFDAQYDSNVVNIDSIDFSHMDLSQVNDMGYMFQGCSSLESVTFSENAPKALNNVAGMFSKCSELKSIDLSNFILSGNAEYTSLFSGCNNLIAIDFPKIPNPGMNLYVVIFDLGVQGTTSSKLQLKYVNMCPLSKSLGIIAMGFSFFFSIIHI